MHKIIHSNTSGHATLTGDLNCQVCTGRNGIHNHICQPSVLTLVNEENFVVFTCNFFRFKTNLASIRPRCYISLKPTWVSNHCVTSYPVSSRLARTRSNVLGSMCSINVLHCCSTSSTRRYRDPSNTSPTRTLLR